MSKETEEAYQKGWAKGTRRILGDDANVYGIGREDMKEEFLKLIDEIQLRDAEDCECGGCAVAQELKQRITEERGNDD